jgi:hypothetical protein
MIKLMADQNPGLPREITGPPGKIFFGGHMTSFFQTAENTTKGN